jgi:hypothetical protein
MINLLSPQNVTSGVADEVLIAPVSWFAANGIKAPLADSTVITTDHVLLAGKNWVKLALAPEKNKLEAKTIGDKGFAKLDISTTVVIPGSYAEAHEVMKSLLNVPLIVLHKDSSCAANFYYQLGSACSFAYLTTDFSTGTTADGIKGYTATVNYKNGYVATYIGAVSPVAPAVVPVLTSAVILNNNASKIILTYDRILNWQINPAPGDYSIAGNTINAVNIVGNYDVEILVNNPYMTGDVVAISYTAGTNKLQDMAGGLAANLTNSPVVNNL